MTYPCDCCDGTGEIYTHERRAGSAAYLTKCIPCPDCDGTGALIAEETLDRIFKGGQ